MIKESNDLAIEMQWDALAADPAGRIDQLLKRQARNRREAHQLRLLISEARRVEKSKNTIAGWLVNGIPEPAEKEDKEDGEGVPRQRSGTHDRSTAAGQPRGPRRERIKRVFSQDPERAWKTREVAEALGEENVKSVRVTLDDMVKGGELIKNSDSSYQLDDE